MYTIFVKGWGDDEDRYYAHSTGGNTIEGLITETFKDWEFEAVYYVMHNSTLDTVAEGVINEGVY